MNDDAKIPVRFLATCGSVGNTKSFIVIVVHLQEDGFTFLGNESPPPEHGFLNPWSALPQCWMAHAGGRRIVSVDAEDEAPVVAVQMDEMEDD
jgi:formylglycine-generating enzyme required for sulfatase activity